MESAKAELFFNYREHGEHGEDIRKATCTLKFALNNGINHALFLRVLCVLCS